MCLLEKGLGLSSNQLKVPVCDHFFWEFSDTFDKSLKLGNDGIVVEGLEREDELHAS